MSEAKHVKKLKKLQQLLHNRRHLHINQQAETHERSRDLEKERDEEVRASLATSSKRSGKKSGPGNVVWSAQYQEIMDRNTGRKRMAADRWNRFAGTGESGGRGL